jgi:hypothetical protein
MHATVFIDTLAHPEHSPETFAHLLERDLAFVARRLALPAPAGLAVFVVSRDTDVESLIGGRQRGLSWGAERTILLLDNDTLAAPLRHELAHTVTFAAWGQPAEPSRWITEGIAVAVDGCSGQPARAVAKRLLLQHRLPGLETVIDSLPSLPLGEGYAAAGSFLSFLEVRYGHATWKALWVGGSSQLKVLTGRDAAWRTFVRKSATTAPMTTVARLAGRNCG